MIFDASNLGYWVLLGSGILLYLFVIFSGGGDDDLDMEADFDADIDADIDLDADVDGDLDGDTEVEGEGFGLWSVLSWFGFGQAPLMLLLATDLSLWGLLGWMFNVGLRTPTGFLGIVVFFGSGAIAFWIGKLLAYPLGKVFAAFGEDVSSDRLIGCLGVVSSKTLPHYVAGKIGQADVYDSARNLMTVPVSLPHWAEVIPRRGDKILIVDRTEHSYLAIAKDSSDEDRWLAEVKQLPQ
ncbi:MULTISPECIES: OB-fold-containig protein [Cyanophyceae]|uniref:OB-fold-containig protein n=1 Tax=Cyanophyceae TaxID=3028117 RepID=UPI00016DCE90|nr:MULTISPECIES: OB-fold-containig protein [Cyanophyceae]ACB00626.1 conserved hypothetical protein [Picosynechococcus sp. PCC 7002]SMH50895.1 Protein of unknown function [Picosynechococcus sp. OG1]SMQ81938.1 Protein of unknown function [Synechococcus sp. 7002]